MAEATARPPEAAHSPGAARSPEATHSAEAEATARSPAAEAARSPGAARPPEAALPPGAEATRPFPPEPTAAATLIYDGDCEFCRRCAEAARRRLGGKVEVLAYQEADLAAIGLTAGQAEDAAWWISENGERFGAHRCVAKALIEAEGVWRLLGRMLEWPVISQVAGGVYRLVSRNRHRLGCSGCIKRRQRGGSGTRQRGGSGTRQRGGSGTRQRGGSGTRQRGGSGTRQRGGSVAQKAETQDARRGGGSG